MSSQNKVAVSMQGENHTLVFSDKLYKQYFPPIVYIKIAYMTFSSRHSVETVRALWKESSDGIKPRSLYNRALLAEKLHDLNNVDGDVVTEALPTDHLVEAPPFDFLQSLNDAELALPEAFFLKQSIDNDSREFLDTALSEDGLDALMSYYGETMSSYGAAFSSAEAFQEKLPEIMKQAALGPVACLVCLEPSKRHVTGFYFPKIVANEPITCHLFDTTGLTLPGYPCGYRGYGGSELPNLSPILRGFKEKGILPAIMPVNTAVSIQHDPFSCLMATILFFNSMQKGEYEYLSEPGITDSYGSSFFHKSRDSKEEVYSFTLEPVTSNTRLYTINSLPLLVGCQDRLAMLMMLDPLQKADRLLPDVVRFRADWQRMVLQGEASQNAFWRAAYVELLTWFNACYCNGQALSLPDFDKMVRQGWVDRTGKSTFEERVTEIRDTLPVEGLTVPVLPVSSATVDEPAQPTEALENPSSAFQAPSPRFRGEGNHVGSYSDEDTAYQAAMNKLTQLPKTEHEHVHKHLVALMAQITLLKRDGKEKTTHLTRAMEDTYQRLTGQMGSQDYHTVAKTMQRKPSMGLKLLGGIMLALGIAVALFSIVFFPPLGVVATVSVSMALNLSGVGLFALGAKKDLSKTMQKVDDALLTHPNEHYSASLSLG